MDKPFRLNISGAVFSVALLSQKALSSSLPLCLSPLCRSGLSGPSPGLANTAHSPTPPSHSHSIILTQHSAKYPLTPLTPAKPTNTDFLRLLEISGKYSVGPFCCPGTSILGYNPVGMATVPSACRLRAQYLSRGCGIANAAPSFLPAPYWEWETLCPIL